MNQTNFSRNRLSRTAWKTLGELEVHAGSDAERVIQLWLTETLKPLALHPDLLSRISRSAWEAATRALELERDALNDGHIHLLTFAPASEQGKGQTWGFFRLEKLEDSTPDQSSPGHSIEFYLYSEGASVNGKHAP